MEREEETSERIFFVKSQKKQLERIEREMKISIMGRQVIYHEDNARAVK
jgi:hypothetical protein